MSLLVQLLGQKLKEIDMTTVYVAVRLIVEPGQPEQILGCYEFDATDWMAALDMAYNWLKQHRKQTCTYHVYC